MNRSLRTTAKQRGGITGRGFVPGVSGNPAGRPKSERRLLVEMYGEAGETVYRRLEVLRNDTKTPAKLKVQIDEFLIERLHGRAQQRIELDSGEQVIDALNRIAEKRATALKGKR